MDGESTGAVVSGSPEWGLKAGGERGFRHDQGRDEGCEDCCQAGHAPTSMDCKR
jgi:hypothetical protein